MRKLFLLLCALLSLVNVVAQVTTASLRGVIVNSSNEVLVGATVVLSHPQTGREYAVVSGVDGRYALHGVRPASDYVLVRDGRNFTIDIPKNLPVGKVFFLA